MKKHERRCFVSRVARALRMPRDTKWNAGGLPCCPNCGMTAADKHGCGYCGQRFRNAVTIGELRAADRAIREELAGYSEDIPKRTVTHNAEHEH